MAGGNNFIEINNYCMLGPKDTAKRRIKRRLCFNASRGLSNT